MSQKDNNAFDTVDVLKEVWIRARRLTDGGWMVEHDSASSDEDILDVARHIVDFHVSEAHVDEACAIGETLCKVIETPSVSVDVTERVTPVCGSESGGVQLWEGGPYWSECNLGATKPEDFGHCFMWGGTTGYVRNENGDGWVSAKDGSPFKFTAQNCATFGKETTELTKMGYLDGNGTLAPEHDAATVYLGAPWRMPTKQDVLDLIEKCDSEWTSLNGVFGRLVKGKGDFAVNSIFLPAAGFGYDSRLYDPGSLGYYWSSTPYSDYSDYAWYLYFYSGLFDRYYYRYRYYGFSVRPLRGFAK